MVVGKASAVESLLGVLSLGPMSGYEMRQFMEQSTGNFWNESFGQIYPALKSMLADGLVERDGKREEGHPAKKVYRITEAGRERLKAWLGVPARPEVRRIELLLKIFFGDQREPEVMRRQVEAFRERCLANLQRYEGIRRKLEAEHRGPPMHPGLPYWLMTVRYGIAEAKALLGWAEETIVELQGLGI